MQVVDIINGLDTLAPFKSSLDWDNTGLLVGDPLENVKGIYVALDATDNVINRAIQKGANLLITHHPMIFSPVRNVRADDMIGRRILEMAKNRMSYIAMHTNFDVHIMGSLVADKLSLQRQRVLDITDETGKEPIGIGRFGEIDQRNLSEFATMVKQTFGLPHVSFFGAADTKVKYIAICPGAGKSEIDNAIKMGADVLLTGDISHHSGIDALAGGLCIIDAGHYGLEHVFIKYMQVWLHDNYEDINVMGEDINFPIQVIK